MTITKYAQSCLVIKEKDQTIIIDPGSFSEEFQEAILSSINKLGFILITHEHADHMSLPLIKAIQQKFPDVTIISNKTVANILEKDNIVVSTDIVPNIAFETVSHEKLWFGNPTENSVFTIFSRLTHPGDSLHFTSSAEILALPLTAPWGSTVQAVEKALELKPKVIIPIHDALWKDEVRKSFYVRLKDFFSQQKIDFRGIENGETIEV